MEHAGGASVTVRWPTKHCCAWGCDSKLHAKARDRTEASVESSTVPAGRGLPSLKHLARIATLIEDLLPGQGLQQVAANQDLVGKAPELDDWATGNLISCGLTKRQTAWLAGNVIGSPLADSAPCR
eukprot:3681873-Rhodomonas_salina.2